MLKTISQIMFCLSKLRDWYQLHPIPTAAMADFPSISINFALILFLYGPGSDVREAGGECHSEKSVRIVRYD
jgi:hypothetical protein